MRSNKNIEVSKCFFIRRSRLGENVIIEFKDIHGLIWNYNHDDVYNELKDRFENMQCFKDYNCYTSTRTVPRYVQELNCVNIVNKINLDSKFKI